MKFLKLSGKAIGFAIVADALSDLYKASPVLVYILGGLAVKYVPMYDYIEKLMKKATNVVDQRIVHFYPLRGHMETDDH